MYSKKNHNFIDNYYQVGGNGINRQILMNFLKRGPIKQYSVNFDQHKNFCGFFDESIIDDF